MIMVAYRLLCLLMAALAVRALLGSSSRQQRVTIAVVAIPLVLRALLIK